MKQAMIDLSQIEIDAQTPQCRLCGGVTERAFELTLLKRHHVAYWQCQQCRSLQTDPPYWLDEAYARTTPIRDTGMVARTIQMAQLTSAVLNVAGITPEIRCLDFGGGNGLFCRMMRDQGFDFRAHDKYAAPFYSVGFTDDLSHSGAFGVVTSFEVFEHLPEPKQDLGAILALRPNLWIFSTQLYRGQREDWNYLAPATGTHVFFYGVKAMHDFAAEHGFTFIEGRYVHMFVRRDDNPFLRSKLSLWLARRILSGSRLATLGAIAQHASRQRNAYLRWQADRDNMAPLNP
jgi:hypothetical protein